MSSDDKDESASIMYNQPGMYESFCHDIFASSSLTFPLADASKNHQTFSIFGDTDCGEPMKSQRLRINFTPDAEIDNAETQKKCCEFWDFINSNPSIQHLVAVPVPVPSSEYSESKQPSSLATTTGSVPNTHDEEYYGHEKTAVSILEECEGKDLIKRAFEPRICLSHCSTVNREYVENQTSTRKAPSKAARSVYSKTSSSPEAVALCEKIEEWDKKHPKSMDPPGHIIQHLPILQRIRKPPI